MCLVHAYYFVSNAKWLKTENLSQVEYKLWKRHSASIDSTKIWRPTVMMYGIRRILIQSIRYLCQNRKKWFIECWNIHLEVLTTSKEQQKINDEFYFVDVVEWTFAIFRGFLDIFLKCSWCSINWVSSSALKLARD